MLAKFIAIFEDGFIVTKPEVTEKSYRAYGGLKHNGKRPVFIFVYQPVTDSLIMNALMAVHPVTGKVFVDNVEFSNGS